MNRFELGFQFIIGSIILTLLNLYVFNDKLPQALVISLIVWAAFFGGRIGGRFFRRCHRKMQG